jgi:RHS repeat-associated protein
MIGPQGHRESILRAPQVVRIIYRPCLTTSDKHRVMMRVRASVFGLAFFLAGAAPPPARAGAQTNYSSDELGRLASVTTEFGTTKYKYFDSGSIAQMVDPGGWRYSFTEGDAPATLASAAPNFLPSLATAVSSPLDPSANRFLFTGFMYERELGLYLTPSGRLYDPIYGRFVQQDSHLGSVSDPPSLHRYAYGNANPLRYVDPTGHETASAGCYWGPSSCGPQTVPLTGVEKRAFAGLLGTLSWAGKAALETVNLALGRHWEGFGESFLKAADHPIDAAIEAKGRFETHVSASLDRAQERLDKGDDFGAAFAFTEQVTAPTAAAVSAQETWR